MVKKVLSRAKWKGNRYFRKNSKTWRDKSSGQVYSKSGNKVVGEREPTYYNLYDRDKVVKKVRDSGK